MKISVDIDGVLLDTMITYCEIFNKKYGTTYSKNDVTDWEFFHDWNISESEAWEIFLQIYENSMDSPFIDKGIPEILKEINKNYDVYIVSARMDEYRRPIVRKLRNHGIYRKIHYSDLILLFHKPYDLKLKSKFDVYIDDSPNLVEPIKKLKDRVLLLYDQPWNQKAKIEENVIRVKNWGDIADYFQNLK